MAPAKNLTMVMNAGSSSLKFKVFQALGNGELESLASGLCERIGDTANSRMKVGWVYDLKSASIFKTLSSSCRA